MVCRRRVRPCERCRGFDGDCGSILQQNITFSHICFKLLMLPQKTVPPPGRVQVLYLCQQVLQQNLSIRKPGGCEAVPLRRRSGAWIVTYACPSTISRACVCCRKVLPEGVILLTVWASEDCGNMPAADQGAGLARGLNSCLLQGCAGN